MPNSACVPRPIVAARVGGGAELRLAGRCGGRSGTDRPVEEQVVADAFDVLLAGRSIMPFRPPGRSILLPGRSKAARLAGRSAVRSGLV